MLDNDALDRSWQCVQELIFLGDSVETVVCPVVSIMVVDLINQSLRQWLVVSEPRQECHPIMQLRAPIDSSHSLVIIRDDFNE